MPDLARGSDNSDVRIPTPSLVAETVLLPAIRALPGDPVAAHPPEILLHAGLTDGEPAAAALPQKGHLSTAAMAVFRFRPPTPIAPTGRCRRSTHGSPFPVTGIAAIISAFGGLLLALHQTGLLGSLEHRNRIGPGSLPQARADRCRTLSTAAAPLRPFLSFGWIGDMAVAADSGANFLIQRRGHVNPAGSGPALRQTRELHR